VDGGGLDGNHLILLTLILHMSQSEEEITPEEEKDTNVSDEDVKE
jgi:hypothetical protein